MSSFEFVVASIFVISLFAFISVAISIACVIVAVVVAVAVTVSFHCCAVDAVTC